MRRAFAYALLLVAAPAANAVDMCQVGKRADYQYWIDVSSYELKPGTPTPLVTVKGGTLHPATDRRNYLTFIVSVGDCRTGEGNVVEADELMRNQKPFATFSADDESDPAVLGRLVCRAYKAPAKERKKILEAGSCGKRGAEPGDGIGFGRVRSQNAGG